MAASTTPGQSRTTSSSFRAPASGSGTRATARSSPTPRSPPSTTGASATRAKRWRRKGTAAPGSRSSEASRSRSPAGSTRRRRRPSVLFVSPSARRRAPSACASGCSRPASGRANRSRSSRSRKRCCRSPRRCWSKLAPVSPGRAPRRRARAFESARDLAERARGELAAHFAEALPLGELARRLGSSPFHLARSFRRVTGTTLHAHQIQLRLRAAVERLARPGIDLTGLALDLGFSSHSHFTAAFRRAFGAPPAALRGRLARDPRQAPGSSGQPSAAR